MAVTVDFRADLAPFSRALNEMLMLVRRLGPEGLDLLVAFFRAHSGKGFSITRVAQVDGVAVMIREPSPAFAGFLNDLRRRCAEGVHDA